MALNLGQSVTLLGNPKGDYRDLMYDPAAAAQLFRNQKHIQPQRKLRNQSFRGYRHKKRAADCGPTFFATLPRSVIARFVGCINRIITRFEIRRVIAIFVQRRDVRAGLIYLVGRFDAVLG